MLYVWKVTGLALDETDALVVADVLKSTLCDERNDPDELVSVTQRPATLDERRAWQADGATS